MEKNKKETIEGQVDLMSKEEVNEVLKNKKELIDSYVEGIALIQKKMEELAEDPKVKSYIEFSSFVDRLEESISNEREEMDVLNRKICNHSIVYLMKVEKRELKYRQDLKCVKCGTSLNILRRYQKCINETFTKEDEFSYNGSEDEYNNLNSLYKNIVSDEYNNYDYEGLSENERNIEFDIVSKLRDELLKKYKKPTNSLLLKRHF